jgi:hypothetical protein
VYIDNLAQPDSKVVDTYTQTLTRYTEYGIVQFTLTHLNLEISGEVLVRVVEHTGGRHAPDIISSLLAEAGLTDYIDATSLAAAYFACPNGIINARFEGGGERNRMTLKDISSMGMTIADALKEITSRCLYWIFVDAGKVKVIPYTGSPPASPVLALTASNKWGNSQTMDLESIKASSLPPMDGMTVTRPCSMWRGIKLPAAKGPDWITTGIVL